MPGLFHASNWGRRAAVFRAFGWLCTTVASSGFSHAEAGKTGSPAGGDAQPPLHGVVLTTNDEPVANATVTIKGMLAGRGAIYVSDAPDCNRQAQTKADGSFSFEGLVAKTKFQGVVTAPGFRTGYLPEASHPGEPLKIKLFPAPTADDPIQTVRGRVVDANGKPITAAKIQVYMMHTRKDWHSGGGDVFTDEDGGFVFRGGNDFIACDFTITADGYVPRAFSEVAGRASTTEYRLSQGTSLTGRLLKDGEPVPDAGVGLSGVKGGSWINNYSVVTDANGRFVFSGIPAHQEYNFFGIMRSLRELGALPRQLVKTGDEGTRLDLGNLNLVRGYKVSGKLQMTDGKPGWAASFSLARTAFTPTPGHVPTTRERRNSQFDGETSFDDWRIFPEEDGTFEFTGVPAETVSIFLMLKPFDMLSPRNVSSDGKGFRLLGTVVSNKTDLVIEFEPHSGQVFPPARDYEALSHQPLQGAEAAIAK